MALCIELSTIFMNFRSMYDKKDFGNFGPQLLQILFFIFFTILRMFFMPWGFYYFHKQY